MSQRPDILKPTPEDLRRIAVACKAVIRREFAPGVVKRELNKLSRAKSRAQ